MSYVLINGKRYYKDDRTGRTTLDNVSQAEADRRAQRSRSSNTTRVGQPSTVAGSGNGRNVSNSINTTRATASTGFPWKGLIACAVIAMFIGAFFYNYFHTSAEEQAITNYMNAQHVQAEVGADEAETKYVEESEECLASSDYLIPSSSDCYLEACDIENYSKAEIQLIINEIYARHGREFHSQDNVDYFSARDWYNPIPGKTDEKIVGEFNEYEKANVELLCEYL